jgi:hypothetical protein
MDSAAGAGQVSAARSGFMTLPRAEAVLWSRIELQSHSIAEDQYLKYAEHKTFNYHLQWVSMFNPRKHLDPAGSCQAR